MTGSPRNAGALVLFSGGQDSATCLAWALDRFERVETLGFDYGQRHRVELDCRSTLRERMAALDPGWAARLGPDHTLDLGIGFGGGFGCLFRGLEQRTDLDVEAQIREGRGDHLLAAVMAVLAHLGEHDPRRAAVQILEGADLRYDR